MNKKILPLILSFCVLFSLVGCNTKTKDACTAVSSETAVQSTSEPTSETANPENAKLNAVLDENLKVHFIDVGQGDCEFIELPNDETMLIDAGNQGNGNEIVSYISALGYDKLDYVIATHPHADHIGGMATVLNAFEIGKMYMPKKEHTSQTFENMLDTIEEKGIALHTAKSGVNIISTDNLSVDLLAPIGNSYSDLNNYSAVCKITYGNDSFLFMGDAEDIVENELLSGNASLNADVLKVGHHGSSYSSTNAFVKAVSPQYAVISCGAGNQYRHPHFETLATLSDFNTNVYRTDESGTIIITSDGANITVDKNASTIKENAPPVVSTEETTSSDSAHNVYITKSGSKYHSLVCQYLKKSQIEISLQDAISRGYEPCSKCNP